MANTKITTAVIKDDAITTAKIADDAVTGALIADDVALAGNPTTTTQSAGNNTTRIATTAFVTTAINNLVDSAPSALDTLNELAAAMGDDANFSTTVTNSIATKLPLAGGTMTGDLILGDNVKLEVGSASGGDLQIYHDTNHSYIEEAGTGALKIKGDDVRIENASGNNIIKAVSNSAELYENGSKKLETTSAGVDVTGRINATSNHSQLTLTDSDDSKFALVSYSSSKYIVRNNSTSTSVNQFTLTEDGKFGIGRTDPSQVFEAHKSSGGDQTVAKFSAHNYGDTGKTFIEIGTEYGDGSSRIGSFNDSGNKSVLVFDVHSNTSGSFEEAMRITSAGKIGINTPSPSAFLHIKDGDGTEPTFASDDLLIVQNNDDASDDARITIVSGNAGEGKIGFGDDGGRDRGRITYDHSDNSMAFGTDGSAANFKLLSSGNIEIADGNLSFASGHGINFNATADSSGSMTSELFDDYEEGTWTPQLEDASGNDCGQASQTGHYTKIGNKVYVHFAIGVNSKSGVGNALQISGLPFTVENVAYGSGEPSAGLISYATSLTSGAYGAIIARANNASTFLELKYTGAGNITTYLGTALNAADIGASTYITGSCTYRS